MSMYVGYISWSVVTIEHQLQFAINHLSQWLCRMNFPSLQQRASVYWGVYILVFICSIMTATLPLLQFSSFCTTALPGALHGNFT